MMVAGVASVTVSDWLALGYLIVFATAVAQQAWLFGVKGVGPSRASVLGNLTPVAAIGLSALILGNPWVGLKLSVSVSSWPASGSSIAKQPNSKARSQTQQARIPE